MARPPRHSGISYVGRKTFLITTITRDRIKAFQDIEFGRSAMAQLLTHAAKHRFAFPAYVYMEDHAHVITLGLTPTSDVRKFVASWKQDTGFAWSQRVGGKLWQPGFWDTRLRVGSSIAGFIDYVVKNPVRAGLVNHPAEYPLIGSTLYTLDELFAMMKSDG